MKRVHEFDPRGLIGEAYEIIGISAPECRSIFLDWVLGAAASPDLPVQIAALLAAFGQSEPDHPMSAVLREGLGEYQGSRRRRGGRKGRSR